MARARACTLLATELRTGGRFVQALDRIFVWEQCNDYRLREEIVAGLMLHPFRVPRAEADIALAQLTDHIRMARNNRGDALPSVITTLEKHRGTRLRRNSTFYLARPAEDIIAQRLQETGGLALTGHSKSGKSSFASDRLDRLQSEGWRCEVFHDEPAALRFLHVADEQNRACLLDDPLENVQPENLAWHLSKLREAGECCGPARCLFVTARLETLWPCQPGYIRAPVRHR